VALLAEAKPADRKRLLLRMLGVDQVDAAVDRARRPPRRRGAPGGPPEVLPDPARLKTKGAAAPTKLAKADLRCSTASTRPTDMAAARVVLTPPSSRRRRATRRPAAHRAREMLWRSLPPPRRRSAGSP